MIPIQADLLIRTLKKLIRETNHDWENEKDLHKKRVIADQKTGMEKALQALQDNYDHQQRTYEQVANG